MKKLALVCLMWIPAFFCSAQKLTHEQFFLSKGIFDAQAGLALPGGDFALSNIIQPEAGYAKSGYNVKIGLAYDVAPFLGLAVQYQYSQNPVNSSNLLADLQTAASSTVTDIAYNSYSSDPWRLNGVLMGAYYPFKAAKTTIDLRLMGGIFSGTLPQSVRNVTRPSTSETFNFKQIETKATDFGFQAGIKLRYQLYRQLVLSSSIDYTQVSFDFEDIRIVETYSNTSYRARDYTQKFQLFNFSVGLGLQFD